MLCVRDEPIAVPVNLGVCFVLIETFAEFIDGRNPESFDAFRTDTQFVAGVFVGDLELVSNIGMAT